MNSQFKKGVLEVCVLAKIFNKDMYGYEIVSTLSENIDVTEGTIYTILRRLTKDEFLESYLVESIEGPARRYYRITQKGSNELFSSIGQWKMFSRAVDKIFKEVF